jgi:hypothetical protein
MTANRQVHTETPIPQIGTGLKTPPHPGCSSGRRDTLLASLCPRRRPIARYCCNKYGVYFNNRRSKKVTTSPNFKIYYAITSFKTIYSSASSSSAAYFPAGLIVIFCNLNLPIGGRVWRFNGDNSGSMAATVKAISATRKSRACGS